MFTIKKLVMVVITSFVVFNCYSQSDISTKKRNWGIVVQSAVFQKTITKPNYGTMEYNTRNTASMIYGITYDWMPKKQISIKTGLFFGTTPVLNGSALFKKEDIYYDQDYYYNEDIKTTSFLITYLPIKLTYKIAMDNKTLNFEIGPQFQYTYESELSTGLILVDYDNTGNGVEVFSAYVEGFNKVFVDLQSSIGLYYKIGSFIFNTSIVYNLGIKDKFTGEYQFANLLISEPTRGKLHVSGSYIGLSVEIYLKKKK